MTLLELPEADDDAADEAFLEALVRALSKRGSSLQFSVVRTMLLMFLGLRFETEDEQLDALARLCVLVLVDIQKVNAATGATDGGA